MLYQRLSLILLLLLSALFTFTRCNNSGADKAEGGATAENQESLPDPDADDKKLKIYNVQVSRLVEPTGGSSNNCTDTDCFAIVQGRRDPQLIINIKNCDNDDTYTQISLNPTLTISGGSTLKLSGRTLSQLEAGRDTTVKFDIPSGTDINSVTKVSIQGQWTDNSQPDSHTWTQDKACTN